jgi:xylan 1,4-beta-xylosidase
MLVGLTAKHYGFIAAAALLNMGTAAAADLPVSVSVDAGHTVAPLPPFWRFFGADEPNYATMKHGARLLLELGGLRPGEVHFRAHNLLTTGDGTADFKWGSTNIYTEDKQGRPVYDWTIIDGIIDTYRARGVHPYLEIGFMPQAMSSAPAGIPYRHVWRAGADNKTNSGWTYPPADYEKWAELVYRWTLHNVERYGRAEVERWYFEVWNEPNLDFYWHGSPAEFYRLHDYGIDAVRRALPTARVGGPDVAGSGGAFMDGFLAHVTSGTNYATGEVGTPTDFVSFHAKGQPSIVDGHVRMGISNQLRTADEGFARTPRFPHSRPSRSSSARMIPRDAPPAQARRTPIATAPCIRATPPPAMRGCGSWRGGGRSGWKGRCPGHTLLSASHGSPATASSQPTASICRCSTSSA